MCGESRSETAAQLRYTSFGSALTYHQLRLELSHFFISDLADAHLLDRHLVSSAEYGVDDGAKLRVCGVKELRVKH